MKFEKWSKEKIENVYKSINSEKKFDLLVEQIQLPLILEAISKEQKEKDQKEKDQREMNKIKSQPFQQILIYLNNKWENKKPTKENIIQRRNEYKRLKEIALYAHDIQRGSDKATQNYIKNITGKYSLWLTGPGQDNDTGSSFNQFSDGSTFLGIGKPKFEKNYGLDINFKTTNKQLRKSLRKYIILHEYGHLYEFIKYYVENGKIQELPDTVTTDSKTRIDNEGKANAYAIDNMYRKDRRELLKNSDLTKEKYNSSTEEKILNKPHYMSNEYLAGAIKHSKTLKKTLDSIEKEKSYFGY